MRKTNRLLSVDDNLRGISVPGELPEQLRGLNILADCSVIYTIVKYHYACHITGIDSNAVEPARPTTESQSANSERW